MPAVPNQRSHSIPKRRRRRGEGRRGGYTLLELLLVLSILLLVGAAVTPAVMGMLANHRLKESTSAVQTALAATRIHAIDLNSTYQFRFEAGGRRFCALPTDGDVVTYPPNQAGGANPYVGRNGVQSRSVEFGELSETTSFQIVSSTGQGSQNAAQSAAMTNAADTAWSAAIAKMPNGGTLGSNWSAPIFFRPDGTASDAAFEIVDPRNCGYRITVRELTGEIAARHFEQGTL